MNCKTTSDVSYLGTIALTGAQRKVLELFSKGVGTKKIAADLEISESAVKARLVGARRKLGARTTAHAVAVAIRSGHIN